jgi:hypothetical protein
VSPVMYGLGVYILQDGILHSHRRANVKSYEALMLVIQPQRSVGIARCMIQHAGMNLLSHWRMRTSISCTDEARSTNGSVDNATSVSVDQLPQSTHTGSHCDPPGPEMQREGRKSGGEFTRALPTFTASLKLLRRVASPVAKFSNPVRVP